MAEPMLEPVVKLGDRRVQQLPYTPSFMLTYVSPVIEIKFNDLRVRKHDVLDLVQQQVLSIINENGPITPPLVHQIFGLGLDLSRVIIRQLHLKGLIEETSMFNPDRWQSSQAYSFPAQQTLHLPDALDETPMTLTEEGSRVVETGRYEPIVAENRTLYFLTDPLQLIPGNPTYKNLGLPFTLKPLKEFAYPFKEVADWFDNPELRQKLGIADELVGLERKPTPILDPLGEKTGDSPATTFRVYQSKGFSDAPSGTPRRLGGLRVTSAIFGAAGMLPDGNVVGAWCQIGSKNEQLRIPDDWLKTRFKRSAGGMIADPAWLTNAMTRDYSGEFNQRFLTKGLELSTSSQNLHFINIRECDAAPREWERTHHVILRDRIPDQVLKQPNRHGNWIEAWVRPIPYTSPSAMDWLWRWLDRIDFTSKERLTKEHLEEEIMRVTIEAKEHWGIDGKTRSNLRPPSVEVFKDRRWEMGDWAFVYRMREQEDFPYAA